MKTRTVASLSALAAVLSVNGTAAQERFTAHPSTQDREIQRVEGHDDCRPDNQPVRAAGSQAIARNVGGYRLALA